jgi:hypothetical protein
MTRVAAVPLLDPGDVVEPFVLDPQALSPMASTPTAATLNTVVLCFSSLTMLFSFS